MNLTERLASANKISTVVDQWLGESPESLSEGKPIEALKLDDIIGKEIVIFGIIKRKGKDQKTKAERDYLTICCVPSITKKVSILHCSGEVVYRKLVQVAENNSFPVVCKIDKPKGKRYYDIQ